MALNISAKFEGKLTCVFKNDMMNLENFHQSRFESLKLWTFVGSFYPKQKIYDFKIYRAVMCHRDHTFMMSTRKGVGES